MAEARGYDAVIIGAGSVGVPAALAFARAGIKTLVIDKAASQGQGSQKAAIGGVRATHSDPAKIRLCLRSVEILSTWEEQHGSSIEWTTGGYSFVAYRDREEGILKSLLDVQRQYGLNIDWHDSESLLEIVPALRADGLLGGTFSPEDGHCSTLLTGHALYKEALQLGAEFAFNETVTGIDVESGRVRGVKTSAGLYSADVVVNAAGAWAPEVGKLVGDEHPVSPDSHEAGITEPVGHFLGPMVVDIRPDDESANYYFYQLRTGQIVFCITPRPIIPGFDRRETSAFLPLVARRMVGVMPRLANIRVRRTWRGLYPMTPDGSPIVGWSPKARGYLLAIGMCGQGFMIGPGLGELLARTIGQADLSSDDLESLDILSPDREFAGTEHLK